MKKVGINYEVTRRVYEEYEVTDEEYEAIQEGEIPWLIQNDLESNIDSGSGDRDDDWAAVDLETGKQLQDWR